MAKTARTKKLVNSTEIIEKLGARKGAQLITITTKTIPTFRVTNDEGQANPFTGRTLKDTNIHKIARTNGMINWNYANSVNRQRGRENTVEDFKPEPRKWGTRLNGLPFVVYTNKKDETKLYLEMKVERSVDYWYEDDKGNTIDKDLVNSFLRKRSASRQGVKKEVIIRDYDFGNIIAIAMAGDTFVIQDNLTLVRDLLAVR